MKSEEALKEQVEEDDEEAVGNKRANALVYAKLESASEQF